MNCLPCSQGVGWEDVRGLMQQALQRPGAKSAMGTPMPLPAPPTPATPLPGLAALPYPSRVGLRVRAAWCVISVIVDMHEPTPHGVD